jgi:hypothetical protein
MNENFIKIGIVGSRRRNSINDMRIVYKFVSLMKDANKNKNVIIVSGACPFGADSFAAQAAKSFKLDLVEYPIPKINFFSKWEFVKAAYDRNLLIAENSDIGFALVHDDRTGGTENTIMHFNQLKKVIFIADMFGKYYLKTLEKENEISESKLLEYAGIA